MSRKNVVKGHKNVVNSENGVSRPMRTFGMREECVTENAKPKKCANPVLKPTPCHFKSTKGGPHSTRGGGKTSEVTSSTCSIHKGDCTKFCESVDSFNF